MTGPAAPSLPRGLEPPHDRPAPTSPGSDYDALADLFLGEPGAPPSAAGPGASVKPAAREPEPSPIPAAARASAVPVPEASPARGAVEIVVAVHVSAVAGAWLLQHASALSSDGAPVAVVRVDASEVAVDALGPGVRSLGGLRATLREALRACPGSVLLRAEELDLPALLALPRVERVTVLTGADDPAVIAAYRTLKAVAALAPEKALGVVFTACDADRARRGHARLALAARTFLGAEVDLRGVVPALGPARSVRLYAGPRPADVASILDVERAPAAAPDAHAAPARLAPPTPAQERRSEAGGALSRALPGLSALPFDCPDAVGVEMAVGADGALHLCAMATGDAPDAALGALHAAEAWASRHRDLLLAADHRMRLDGPATLHLLTEHAPLVRGRLHGRVRVHLLVPSPGGGAPACADLN